MLDHLGVSIIQFSMKDYQQDRQTVLTSVMSSLQSSWQLSRRDIYRRWRWRRIVRKPLRRNIDPRWRTQLYPESRLDNFIRPRLESMLEYMVATAFM